MIVQAGIIGTQGFAVRASWVVCFLEPVIFVSPKGFPRHISAMLGGLLPGHALPILARYQSLILIAVTSEPETNNRTQTHPTAFISSGVMPVSLPISDGVLF